jgi:hypothetical protein
MHSLVLHTLPVMHLPLSKERSNYLQEYTLIAKSCHKQQVCKHLNSQSTNWKWLMTIAFWELIWVDIISRFSKQNIFDTKSLKRRDNSYRIFVMLLQNYGLLVVVNYSRVRIKTTLMSSDNC